MSDPVADFHAACDKLNNAVQRDVDEVCDDMAEFLANMKPKWYVCKDKDQLIESALETGFVRDISEGHI